MDNPNVFHLFPRSAKRGLRFVKVGPEHDLPGFDQHEVEKALREDYDKFTELVAERSSMFTCGHRVYERGTKFEHVTRINPETKEAEMVDLGGFEVACYYAKDVEAFLKGVPFA